MSKSSATPFPLGAYIGVPDDTSASAEATFEANYASFEATMGTAPAYLDSYIDYTQPVEDWATNAGWAASSSASSADARSAIPVIALPMASTAAGSPTADAQYQAFASGQYDSVLSGIVKAWASEGFTNLVFRPGWEMNLQGPTFAGATAQDQADWVSAFQHIYTQLHADAAEYGVKVSVVWNPATTNYTSVNALTSLYPGNNYVDAIGADVYSDVYPYSDGGSPATYHDWSTGKEDTTAAQFIANPVNRAHYWTYPAATEWNLDSSGGHALSLDQIIQFAEQNGKPLAIPETGAGNSNAGVDVSDDAAFPQWLSQQLTAAEQAGETINFVNLWDSNVTGGNYEFSYASDDKPQEAAAWAQYFGAPSSGLTELATTGGTAQDVACYLAGTRIRTADGDVDVEALRIGDSVEILDGTAKIVLWIGRRSFTSRFIQANPAVLPIRIGAGSLSPGIPERDLLVSPEHAIYIDGTLVAARHLVNGVTITVERNLAAIEYYHIELDGHHVLFAEGCPAESFVDDGSRSMFSNAAERPATLSRGDVPPVYCAPRLASGTKVDAIRRQIAAMSECLAA